MSAAVGVAAGAGLSDDQQRGRRTLHLAATGAGPLESRRSSVRLFTGGASTDWINPKSYSPLGPQSPLARAPLALLAFPMIPSPSASRLGFMLASDAPPQASSAEGATDCRDLFRDALAQQVLCQVLLQEGSGNFCVNLRWVFQAFLEPMRHWSQVIYESSGLEKMADKEEMLSPYCHWGIRHDVHVADFLFLVTTPCSATSSQVNRLANSA